MSPSVRRKGARRAVPFDRMVGGRTVTVGEAAGDSLVEVFAVPFGWQKATAYFAPRSSLICRFNAV